MFKKIVIVCTANICRSPMAEALLRARAPVSEVSSAGTAALAGRPAAQFTLECLQEKGYDMSAHRARQATEVILRSMDLVVAIDSTHHDWIVRNFPHLRGRVHKLGKWRGNIDVADPYGGPKKGFQDAYELIDACVSDWLPYVNPKTARRT